MKNQQLSENFEDILKDITVIIPAAGRGTRFSSKQLKVQMPLTSEKTVLEAALDCFYGTRQERIYFSKILLVISRDSSLQSDVKKLQKKFGANLEWLWGGMQRQDSVWNALEKVTTPWTLIHDAARALLQASDLKHLILNRGDLSGDGATLATPVRDALKRGGMNAAGEALESSNPVKMQQIIDREQLWQTFTPQIFPTQRLKRAMAMNHAKKISFKDEAEAIFLDGGHPTLVQGRWSNLKLTFLNDLEIMQMLYQALHSKRGHPV